MVKMYTTHCPKCNVLQKKLKDAKVDYQEVTDVAEMKKLGIATVPVLEVDGNIMNFAQSVNWINNRK